MHLVVVNTRQEPTLFVNGVRYQGYALGTRAAPPAPLIVGGTTGDYDDIAIYDKALDANRIALHHSIGRGE